MGRVRELQRTSEQLVGGGDVVTDVDTQTPTLALSSTPDSCCDAVPCSSTTGPGHIQSGREHLLWLRFTVLIIPCIKLESSVEQRFVQDGNMPCQPMMAPAAALDKPMMKSPSTEPTFDTYSVNNSRASVVHGRSPMGDGR